MALPGVNIAFANGLIGTVAPQEDGVSAILLSAVELNPVVIYSSDDTHIPVSAANIVKAFYAEAGEGAELWLGGGGDDAEEALAGAKALIKAANGRIRTMLMSGYTTSIIPNAAPSIRTYSLAVNAPVIVIAAFGTPASVAAATAISGHGDGVVALAEVAHEPVLLGRLARIPVERHIGRVRDGALYGITSTPAILSDVSPTADTNGYVTVRKHIGRDGYFFTEDHTATAATDDYHSIARRRTADKAYRIAYDTLLTYVNDNLPVNNDGTLTASAAKAIEQTLITAIYNGMTAEGNLSVDDTDSSDKGVKAVVDTTNDFVATSKLNVTLSIKPYGYAKYIDVTLGFLKE